MDERVLIAKLGLEGGGATILGTCIDGRWSFWDEGTSMFLDENDDEEWRTWVSEPTGHLADVVSSLWPLMSPSGVHPDFVKWFRDHYEFARAGLDESSREYQAGYADQKWQQVFAGTQAP